MESRSVAVDRSKVASLLRRERTTARGLAAKMGVSDRTMYRVLSSESATFGLLDRLAEVVGADVVADLITYDNDRADFKAGAAS